MASTGTSPALPTTLPFTPGQGLFPVASVLYTKDDASDTDPLWIDVTTKVRGFSVSRGRGSERDDIDAGTATITLDNRTRMFDPVADPNIRPMNRWWIREQFSGETQSVFIGYAESYDQSWPGKAGDAVATVSLVDEFKVLALDALPTMNPPRDTYEDLVMSDAPQGYWRFSDHNLTGAAGKELGSPWWAIILDTGSPIAGDNNQSHLILAAGMYVTSGELQIGESGDMGVRPEFAAETWFKIDAALPSATRDILRGPTDSSATIQWRLRVTSSGTVQAVIVTTVSTYTATTAVPLTVGQWYHLAATVELATGNLFVYVNGVLAATQGGVVGVFKPLGTGATAEMLIGDSTSTTTNHWDEVAVYGVNLPAARVLAHYQAGAARGFPTQEPGARVTAILNAVGSQAPRYILDNPP